jgi:hypothetical protein
MRRVGGTPWVCLVDSINNTLVVLPLTDLVHRRSKVNVSDGASTKKALGA